MLPVTAGERGLGDVLGRGQSPAERGLSGPLAIARALRDIAAAVERLAAAERDIAATIAVARGEGH
jgi:hypothetical protein